MAEAPAVVAPAGGGRGKPQADGKGRSDPGPAPEACAGPHSVVQPVIVPSKRPLPPAEPWFLVLTKRPRGRLSKIKNAIVVKELSMAQVEEIMHC